MLQPEDAQHRPRTYGRGRAVRLPEYDYTQDVPTHLILCSRGTPFAQRKVSEMVCENVEVYSERLRFRLFGYCLMPDHLHVLLSTGDADTPIGKWLNSFKSYTTHCYMEQGGIPPLWQRSAYDHVCRKGEVASEVAMYIANNPVRKGLVQKWDDWPWTRVFVEL